MTSAMIAAIPLDPPGEHGLMANDPIALSTGRSPRQGTAPPVVQPAAQPPPDSARIHPYLIGPDMTEISRLPGPLTHLWDWQMHGVCRGVDSEVFFHPAGERGPSRSNREASAKALCAQCPVITACREASLSAREPYGIWGGLSERERQDILAADSPREHAIAS